MNPRVNRWIERTVDRFVIRGEDPRDPGWMKIRAVALVVVPSFVLVGLFELVEQPPTVEIAVPLLVMLLSVRIVGSVINQRIEEIEEGSE